MFLCAFSPAQPAELFPVLCFKAGVCVTHSKWHMWCSFLFQAVFWQIGSLVQAPCHCPSTPNPHPVSYRVSTHSRLLKMPVLCHHEVSKLTFNARPQLQGSYGGDTGGLRSLCWNTPVSRKLWASFLCSLAHQLIWNSSIKVTELHWCKKSVRRESTSVGSYLQEGFGFCPYRTWMAHRKHFVFPDVKRNRYFLLTQTRRSTIFQM